MKILISLLMLVTLHCFIKQVTGATCACTQLKVKKEESKEGFTVEFDPDQKSLSKKFKEKFFVKISATEGEPFDVESISFDLKGVSKFAVIRSFPPCVPLPPANCEGPPPTGEEKLINDTKASTSEIVLQNKTNIQEVELSFTPEKKKGQVKNLVFKGCLIKKVNGNECIPKEFNLKKEGIKNCLNINFQPDGVKNLKKIKDSLSIVVTPSSGKSFNIKSFCFDIKGIPTLTGTSKQAQLCEPLPGQICPDPPSFSFTGNFDPGNWATECAPGGNNLARYSLNFKATNGTGELRNVKIKACENP